MEWPRIPQPGAWPEDARVAPVKLGPTDRLWDCPKEADAARRRINGRCIPCCGAGPETAVFTASFSRVLSSFEASAAHVHHLPLAVSRGRLAVMHLAVLVPEIPGASGAIGRSRPTPSSQFCLCCSPAGRDLPAAGTVPSTAAVPVLLAATRPCAPVSWPLCTGTVTLHFSPAKPGTGYQRLPASQYPDVAVTLP
ncbi:hypothetical protein LI328DRAFT_162290 [Trichoderma asperelloides]|nr:hypothetical protein LI328DRAFT_162290 [Trichoderma asperelloides]